MFVTKTGNCIKNIFLPNLISGRQMSMAKISGMMQRMSAFSEKPNVRFI